MYNSIVALLPTMHGLEIVAVQIHDIVRIDHVYYTSSRDHSWSQCCTQLFLKRQHHNKYKSLRCLILIMIINSKLHAYIPEHISWVVTTYP